MSNIEYFRDEPATLDFEMFEQAHLASVSMRKRMHFSDLDGPGYLHPMEEKRMTDFLNRRITPDLINRLSCLLWIERESR